MKWQVSGMGLVGAVGAKPGCGCPIKIVYPGGYPSSGLTLKALVTNLTAIRMFVASLSGITFDGDPCLLEPGEVRGATVKVPWVLWLIPGNLARISAAQVRELEAVGYDKQQQQRHQDFLRDEMFAKYPEFKPKRTLAEKVKRRRVVPPPSGKRRMQAD